MGRLQEADLLQVLDKPPSMFQNHWIPLHVLSIKEKFQGYKIISNYCRFIPIIIGLDSYIKCKNQVENHRTHKKKRISQ
jgi:hypothetical protein